MKEDISVSPFILFAGYTRKLYGGHGSVPVNKPFPGYNGEDGYRRNTPELRAKPSPFDCEGRKMVTFIMIDFETFLIIQIHLNGQNHVL